MHEVLDVGEIQRQMSLEIVDNESNLVAAGADINYIHLAFPFAGHSFDPAPQPKCHCDDPCVHDIHLITLDFNSDPSSTMHIYPDASEVVSKLPLLTKRRHMPSKTCIMDSGSDPWAFDPFAAGYMDIAALQPGCEEWVLGCPPLASGGDPYREGWLL